MKRHDHHKSLSAEAHADVTTESLKVDLKVAVSGSDSGSEAVLPSHSAPQTTSRMLGKGRYMWILLAIFPLAVVLFLWPPSLQRRAHIFPQSAVLDPIAEPHRHSTGLTDTVQWDNYTMWLLGQRVFIQ